MADTEDEEPTPNSSEEDELERGMSVGSDSFPEALTHFPDPSTYEVGTRPYLQVIRRARAAVDIPIIASLNGTTDAGWIDFAREIERAGASALELNIYFIPADAARWNRRRMPCIPIAVKLNPYFSAPGAVARMLEEAGAHRLALFNRFRH